MNQGTEFDYSSTSNLESLEDALGHTTRYLYDELGRLTETRFHDGTRNC
ncbi:MAG: RHS repeat protein [Leptolyngbya sp. SIO1E4]|nr:RHS repeat protein [Leptolyngbya sp. SIO1E4]